VPGAPYDRPAPLAQGYATVGTDSGHGTRPGVPPQAFALNDEALLNFAHASYKKVRDVSVALMARAYGRGPQKLYFVGSSEGGREGLTMAQRYPADFDGILSRVPVIHWIALQHVGLRDGLALTDGGWMAWWTGSSAPSMPPQPSDGIGWFYGAGAIQYFYARDPKLDLRTCRAQDHAARIREVSALMDSTKTGRATWAVTRRSRRASPACVEPSRGACGTEPGASGLDVTWRLRCKLGRLAASYRPTRQPACRTTRQREHPMTRTASLLLACALALPAAAFAQSASVAAATGAAPGARMAAGEVTVRARVVEIDKASRTATLRGPNGNLTTVAVPAEVKNFDQVNVGDMLLIRHIMAVAARLEPATASGIRERVESGAAASAPAGGAPGVGGVRTVEVLAVVQGIDRKARTATLRGVHRTVRVSVPDGVDMTKIKMGDEVRAVITEAVVLAVEPAPKPAPKR
jgi:hypothetical protein